MLLSAVVLAAFYPAGFAGFSRIDDRGMFDAINGIGGWTFRSIFFPSTTGGLYYRPMLMISFIIDKMLLGLNPGFMHLENILLHLANAILVFFLTLHLLPPDNRQKSFVPLMAGLFFGLHPMTSESVNWISGRTDVLAGTFILLSALFILKYREYKAKIYILLSLFVLLGGVLVKETAVAFLPGALLLITAQSQGDHAFTKSANRLFNNQAAIKLAGVGAMLLLYYVLRKAAFTTSASHVGLTIRILFADWNHSLFVVLRALGFYLKKIIIPYPLNFAIVDVDSLYEILAAPLVVLCVYIGGRKTLASAMFTAGMFLLMPSFLIAFGQIAWTPYAERYVYITLAFVIVAVAVYSSQHKGGGNTVFPKFALLIVLVIMFATTLNRSIIWQDDMKLCRDTVEKSPLSRDMRITYSSLLIQKGDYVEALKQLEQGRSLPFIGYDDRFDHNTAYIYYKQGRLDDAIKISQTALDKSFGTSTWALENLASFLEEKKQKCKNRNERYLIDKRVFFYNKQLYNLNHDPHLLYELGVTAEALGEHQRAVGLFQQACATISDDDQYKRNAIKKLKTLSGISLPAYAEHF